MKNILFNCYYDSDLNDNIFKLDRVWLSSNNKEIKKDDKNKGFSYLHSLYLRHFIMSGKEMFLIGMFQEDKDIMIQFLSMKELMNNVFS